MTPVARKAGGRPDEEVARDVSGTVSRLRLAELACVACALPGWLIIASATTQESMIFLSAGIPDLLISALPQTPAADPDLSKTGLFKSVVRCPQKGRLPEKDPAMLMLLLSRLPVKVWTSVGDV